MKTLILSLALAFSQWGFAATIATPEQKMDFVSETLDVTLRVQGLRLVPGSVSIARSSAIGHVFRQVFEATLGDQIYELQSDVVTFRARIGRELYSGSANLASFSVHLLWENSRFIQFSRASDGEYLVMNLSDGTRDGLETFNPNNFYYRTWELGYQDFNLHLVQEN